METNFSDHIKHKALGTTLYKNNSCLIAKTKVSKYKKGQCLTEKLVCENQLLFLYEIDDVEFGLRRTKLLRVPTVTLSPFCKSTSSEGLHQIAN